MRDDSQTTGLMSRSIVPSAADPGIIATAVLAWMMLREGRAAVEQQPRPRWVRRSRIGVPGNHRHPRW